jgi:hypothetical protein
LFLHVDVLDKWMWRPILPMGSQSEVHIIC